jgi:hypothetical protein
VGLVWIAEPGNDVDTGYRAGLVIPGAAMLYRGIEAARTLYWPIEQVDRRLRPQAWDFVPDGVMVE